jgi:hypothetical protein
MTADRWQWNTPNITSERFDDEIVVVNFESGKYHSIQGDGVTIWQWLEHAPTIDQVIALAIEQFDGDPVEIDQAVRSFIDALKLERLAVPASAAANERWSGTRAGSRTSFRSPALATFSDMQELLWLDPIHEVDESGWPLPRNDAGN